MMFGFGAGGPLADVQVYGVRGGNVGEMVATTNDMLVEAIDIVMNCWQEGGPRDFDGKFWRVRRPVQFDDPLKQGGDFAWHLRPAPDPMRSVLRQRPGRPAGSTGRDRQACASSSTRPSVSGCPP